MNIGIHKNVSAAEYHAYDACSNSRIKGDCPARWKWDWEHPKEQTLEMTLGEAVHLMVLEPEKVSSRLAIAPKVDRRTTKGKDAYAAFELENEDRLKLSADDYERAKGMREAVFSAGASRDLLEQDGDNELTCIFNDVDTGVACKMRLDRLINGKHGIRINDLKTCQSVTEQGIQAAFRDRQYYRQDAFYMYGLPSLDIFPEDFFFTFVESKPPHLVRPVCVASSQMGWRNGERMLVNFREETRKKLIIDLLTYKECQETGVWPGYESRPYEAKMPYGFLENANG